MVTDRGISPTWRILRCASATGPAAQQPQPQQPQPSQPSTSSGFYNPAQPDPSGYGQSVDQSVGQYRGSVYGAQSYGQYSASMQPSGPQYTELQPASSRRTSSGNFPPISPATIPSVDSSTLQSLMSPSRSSFSPTRMMEILEDGSTPPHAPPHSGI